MKHVLFAINPVYSQNEALKLLEAHGLKHSYIVEDSEGFQIGGFLKELLPLLPNITLIEQNEGIDWDKEWATHSPYYKEGLLKIDLTEFGSQLDDPFLYLKPGPGFGDLSHPTTHLMLEWMAQNVQGKHVLDIGCGSGILSIAAHKMGALSVEGIDIDPLAIEHSYQNASLNHIDNIFFSEKTTKCLNINNLVVLINMTFFEQKEVFLHHPSLKGTFILSGILNSQTASYIASFPYSYSQINLSEKNGWTAFFVKDSF